MSEHNLFSHNKKYQFKNKFYYQKYLLFPNDSFIQFLDTLNESRFNYIYIHIPKNAGTTIRYKLKKLYDCLITSNPNNDSCIQGTRQVININHTPFRNYQHPQKLICFVRNPLSRCFSMFYYHKLHKRFLDFNVFIDHIWKSKKTKSYIQDSSHTDVNINLPLLKTPKGNNIAYSWKCQSSWIPEDIFFLGKLENLEEDLLSLCQKLGCKYQYIKIHTNKNPYSYSKDNITEETKSRVFQLYKEDYEKFNYQV